MTRASARTFGLALAALAAVAAARGARADDVTLTLEPRFRDVRSETTDQAGTSSAAHEQDLSQTYRLALDRALYPQLRFAGQGMFEDNRSLLREGVGDLRATSYNGNLTFGTSLLGGSLSAGRREENRLGALAASARLNDTYALNLGWAPVDLPSVGFRASRTHTYDRARLADDITSSDATLSTRYSALATRLQLDGALTYSALADRRGNARTEAFGASGRAGYSDKLFGGRTVTAVGYNVGARTSETVAAGEGGFVTVQQLPAVGLSLVEDPTVDPALDTLDRNGALVDGNTAASASVNVGYRSSEALDQRLRDIGAELPDARTRVNVIRVWVDKALPDPVANAFVWTVWRSDDNVSWLPVARIGSPTFGPFDNRFELVIEETTARFLKVTVAPLPVGVTFDERYRDVFVTELQLFLRQDAASVRGRTTAVENQLTASARTPIPAVAGLAHDVSVLLRRSDVFGGGLQTSNTAWLLSNSLSLARKVRPWLLATGRLRRDDSDDGRGYLGVFAWSGSLAARPLTTLTSTLSYSGALQHGLNGISTQNTVALYNRAQIYSWLGLGAQLGHGVTTSQDGGNLTSSYVNANGDIVPHSTLRLSGTWQLRRSEALGVSRRTQSVSGAASYAPTAATTVSASVLRIIDGSRPTTLGSVSGALSPFQGGDLQLTFVATRSLDTAADTVTTTIAPGARWTVRPGWFLDARYTILGQDSPIGDRSSRELGVSLLGSFL